MGCKRPRSFLYGIQRQQICQPLHNVYPRLYTGSVGHRVYLFSVLCQDKTSQIQVPQLLLTAGAPKTSVIHQDLEQKSAATLLPSPTRCMIQILGPAWLTAHLRLLNFWKNSTQEDLAPLPLGGLKAKCPSPNQCLSSLCDRWVSVRWDD